MNFKTVLPALPEARSFAVLLLLAFALFAPLGVSLHATNTVANPASGACELMSGSVEMDCCCAGPSVPDPVAKSCCSAPAPAEGLAKVGTQRCTCESNPLAPSDELPPVQFTALAPEADPSTQLVAAMHAASLTLAAPTHAVSLPPLCEPRRRRASRPVPSATSGLENNGTAQWLGLLRGTNSRLAFLSINRC